MKKGKDTVDTAEKIHCSRYYEHDGMLRAYANRSMVLALLFGVIATGSLAFAVYVRLQPPTVIRVDADGDATVVSGTPFAGHTRGLTFVASASEPGPSEVEAKAVVRRFLDHYLNYTPATVDKQMADALNMMTGNFRALVMRRLRDDDTIYKIQDDHITSNFAVRNIDAVKATPLTYTPLASRKYTGSRTGRRPRTTSSAVTTCAWCSTSARSITRAGFSWPIIGSNRWWARRTPGWTRRTSWRGRPRVPDRFGNPGSLARAAVQVELHLNRTCAARFPAHRDHSSTSC